MKITYKKGKGDKVHISIDGEYTMTVDEIFFFSLGIKENQEMTSSEWNELAERIGERRAYNCAVSLLSRRDHTRKEIENKLNLKGYGKFAGAVTDKLQSQGYLDDERFARLYVRELINLKGYGRRRINDELYRKGVDREIIREVLSETEIPEGRLVEMINKKYYRYLDSEKGVQKTINALMRLGYSYGEIKDALREISDGCDENDDFYEVADE